MAFRTFGEKSSLTLQPHAQISGNAEKGILPLPRGEGIQGSLLR